MPTKADEIVWRLLTCVGVSRRCGCCWCWWLWWLVDVTVTKISLWHLETPVLQWSWRPHTNWLIYHYKHQHAQGIFLIKQTSAVFTLHCTPFVRLWYSVPSLSYYQWSIGRILKQKYFSSFIHVGVLENIWLTKSKDFLWKPSACFSIQIVSGNQLVDVDGKTFHPDCWTLN